jgi:hypothetical protein
MISLPIATGCSALVEAELNDKAKASDSVDASDASDASSADVTVEAGSLMNVALASNGGKIESFTSEYCNPTALPAECQPGYWTHTNIHDGEYAYGRSPAAFSASWASARKVDPTSPEAFVFSFQGGASARLVRIVLQNYGEEGGSRLYYATHFRLHGQTQDGSPWSLILDLPLETNEELQEFDLVELTGSPVVAVRIKFEITAAVSDAYWDFGEFEAWGHLL